MIFLLSVILVYNIFAQDAREYQHGIDFIKVDENNYWLIWSSSENPPTGASSNGSWTHDIYYSAINKTNPVINSVNIISKYEAQEPASSAITDNGNIMITMEDGWNTNNSIAQRYGVYDIKLQEIKPYPNMVLDGGHSGHVSATKDRFIVFYSDEWVSGGGVDNLGSGDDVLLKVFDSTGSFIYKRDVAVGDLSRDWWPITASSNNKTALVWQRFVDNEQYVDLIYTIYNPYNNQFVIDKKVIETKVRYYTYDVQYISAINRFLIIGRNKNNDGFAYLVDENGDITASSNEIPKFLREAQPAIKNRHEKAYVVYPRAVNGLFVLELTKSSIAVNNEIDDNYVWSYIGTDGIFTDSNSVYFASLSKNGIVEKKYKNVISNLTSVDKNEKTDIGMNFILYQNYPNPFNPETTIEFQIPVAEYIALEVFDVLGNSVKRLLSKNLKAGKHSVTFNGEYLSSGIYYYQLRSNSFIESKKIVLIK